MNWLQVLGFIGVDSSLNTQNTQDSLSSFHAPVLHWRVNAVPDLENTTSVQYSGIASNGDLLYYGVSTGSGLRLMHRLYGTSEGLLETRASVQATPSLLKDQKKIVVGDLSGTVYAWSLPEVSMPPETTLQGDWFQPKPTQVDWENEHSLLWSIDLQIPINTAIVADQERLYVSTNDDVLYALSMDGKVLWRFEHRASPTRAGNLQLFGAGKPLIIGDQVVVGFSDGALLHLSVQDGSVLHRSYNGQGRYPDIIAQPTEIQGGVLASGFEEPVFKVSNESVLWQQSYGSVQGALVDVNGNSTQVFHPGSDGILRKLDTTSGQVVWEWDSDTGAALNQPLWLGDNLLVSSQVAGMYLVDPSDGQEVWRSRFDTLQSGYMQSSLLSGCDLFAMSKTGYIERYVVCDVEEQ